MPDNYSTMPMPIKLALLRMSDREAKEVVDWLDSVPDVSDLMIEKIAEHHPKLGLTRYHAI